MVNMLVDLGEYDACDDEWLPLEEQRKLDTRKKGKSFTTKPGS
jgi:hypothetical protein